MNKEKKKNIKDEAEEMDEGAELCPKCGSQLVWEEGKKICPDCDVEIDFFGDNNAWFLEKI